MGEKELRHQKRRAKLDEWKAEVDKLKARASGASADAQLKLIEKFRAMESRIDDGKKKLAEMADHGEDAWVSVKDGVESAWDSLKSAVSDAVEKFKT